MTSGFPEILVLVGSGRSGSVYLSGLLKQSYGIGFSGEPKFVVPLSNRLGRYGDLSDPPNLRRLAEHIHNHERPFQHLHRRIGIATQPQDILDRVIEPTYTGVLYAVFQLLADKRGRTRLGYRDPYDVTNLPRVAELLPTAKFVHIIRDGRDVASSYRKFDWGPTNLYVGIRRWADVVTKGRSDGRRLGARYFELRLEDLVRDPETVVTPLGHFVGATPAQIDNFRDRLLQTREPDAVGGWKRTMSHDDRLLCETVAGEALRTCGYETSGVVATTVPMPYRAWYTASDGLTRLGRRARHEVARRREAQRQD